MKKYFSTLFILLFVFTSFACKNLFDFGIKPATVSITLPFGQARASWTKEDVTKYTVVLTSSDDSEFNISQTATPENPEVTFSELIPGEYTIEVTAYNEETEIAYGKTKVTLKSGQNATPTIKLTGYDTKPDNPFFAETLETTQFHKIVTFAGDSPSFKDAFGELEDGSYYQLEYVEPKEDDDYDIPLLNYNVKLFKPNEEAKTVIEKYTLIDISNNFLLLVSFDDDDNFGLYLVMTDYGIEQYSKDNLAFIKILTDLAKNMGEDNLNIPFSRNYVNKTIPAVYNLLFEKYRTAEKIPALSDLKEEELIDAGIAKIVINANYGDGFAPKISYYVPAGKIELLSPEFFYIFADSDLTNFTWYSDKEGKNKLEGEVDVKGIMNIYSVESDVYTFTFYSNYEGGPEPYIETIPSNMVKEFPQTAMPGYSYCFANDQKFRYGARLDNKEERYIFCGWSVNGDKDKILQVGDIINTSGSKEFYAVWYNLDEFEKDLNNLLVIYKFGENINYYVGYLNRKTNITLPHYSELLNIKFPPCTTINGWTSESLEYDFDESIISTDETSGSKYIKMGNTIDKIDNTYYEFNFLFYSNFIRRYYPEQKDTEYVCKNSFSGYLDEEGRIEEFKAVNTSSCMSAPPAFYNPNSDVYEFDEWTDNYGNPANIPDSLNLYEMNYCYDVIARWKVKTTPPGADSVELTDLSQITENPSGKFYLTKDLYVTLTKPIANSFSGILDGKGHSIIVVESSGSTTPHTAFAPLFVDITSDAIVKNLKLEAATFTTDAYNAKQDFSPFACSMYGKLIGCEIKGKLSKGNSTNLWVFGGYYEGGTQGKVIASLLDITIESEVPVAGFLESSDGMGGSDAYTGDNPFDELSFASVNAFTVDRKTITPPDKIQIDLLNNQIADYNASAPEDEKCSMKYIWDTENNCVKLVFDDSI